MSNVGTDGAHSINEPRFLNKNIIKYDEMLMQMYKLKTRLLVRNSGTVFSVLN